MADKHGRQSFIYYYLWRMGRSQGVARGLGVHIKSDLPLYSNSRVYIMVYILGIVFYQLNLKNKIYNFYESDFGQEVMLLRSS